ncbi:hypothetical protein K439DRAFT_1641247 [Ramaria rubella]|nr:hypothetical protein K439DRAFT_1641247 [Ramaria rubella]
MQWNTTEITLTKKVAVEQTGRSPLNSSHPQAPAFWATLPQYEPLPAPVDSLRTPMERVRESKQNLEPRRRKVPPVGREYFQAALLHADDGQCNHVNSNGVRRTRKSPTTG